ncbi:uncharacterized protein LOC106666230 [Cimex lectularius]|uniref:Enoyl-CoA hydratase n=1 Tax=Cimex lectularius TaxID=79782 RepID=A0A8I6RNQ6_CIMLE|nr:uncharacterized protein LOC106666230 [Cimex lectularius]XP_014248769.1 uncharacterized protein LOC106666230 [Cimex lectularius]XP_014248770.1 uncharacterized protein LOC106666230 [Cimex lectularius]
MIIQKPIFRNISKAWSIRAVSSISEGAILVRDNGPLKLIGLNRPDKKNCLTLSMVQSLKEVISDFEKDSSTNAAVIYGEKGNFSSGIDEEDLAADPDLIEKIERTGLLDVHCKKPLVAAISGFAIGHALDIALRCDLLVMEDTAFVSVFNRKTRNLTTPRQIQYLMNLFGQRKTLDWALTGRQIGAKEALDCGLASRIVACGTGLGQSVSLANGLCCLPPDKLNSDRALIYSMETSKYHNE